MKKNINTEVQNDGLYNYRKLGYLEKNIYTEVQNDFLYNYRKLGYLEKEHTELMDASLNLKVTLILYVINLKKINKK